MPGVVVIGASGGSGSRVLCRLAIECGIDMGNHLNKALDALALVPFYEATINTVLARTGSLDYSLAQLPADERQRSLAILERCLRTHRAQSGRRVHSKPWGFKNPRSLYVLPFLAVALPGFRFVHLVRDGRDIALSTNQNQAAKHFDALMGGNERVDSAVDSARLWSKANRQVRTWAEANLGPRYHLLQFEALCAMPHEEIARFARFLGQTLDPPRIAQLAELVRPPTSLGRWRKAPPAQQQKLTAAARAGLEAFDYRVTS